MTDNNSYPQRMLFPIVAAVTSQPISPTEERARKIVVVDTSDSRSSNQRRQASRVVSNKSRYEAVYKSLIDALPEFLQADPFEKRLPSGWPSGSQIWFEISTSAIGRSAESPYTKDPYCKYPKLRLSGWKS